MGFCREVEAYMDIYWNVFTKSGSIDAYLGHVEYKRIAEKEKLVTDECGKYKRSCNK